VLAPATNLKSEVSDLKSAVSNLTPIAWKQPRFVVNLDAPLPPEESLVRIPLAITGKWLRSPAPNGTGRGAQEFSITRRDLEEIVHNFQERLNGEINVDYDHASEMPEVAAGGPIPSAGRIVKLDPPEPLAVSSESRIASGGKPDSLAAAPHWRFILWGWYEPTERARALIQNREYRYISPAIDWTMRNKRTGKPQGAALTSVALTNRPFLEEMPQIRLSDPAYLPAGDVPPPSGRHHDAGRTPALHQIHGGPMKQVTLSVVDGRIKVMHADLKDTYVLEPEEMRKCLAELGLVSPATAAAALAESAPELERHADATSLRQPAEATLAAAQEISVVQAAALLSEGVARGKFISAVAFFRAQVERELDEAIRTGKILPRQREDWRKIALSDFSTFRRILAEQKTQVPLRPVGFSGAPPEDVQTQVKLLVEQRCRERQISFGQALTEIGREHPELAQEYRRAVSGSQ